MAMTSPTLFISLPMRADAPWNLARSQRGTLHTMIVERRLEERGRAPRNAVRDVGQRAAERELCGDIGKRVAGRLARKRTRARQPRVDLDDAIVRALRVERVLDVAFADHAQVPDRADRDRAQELVLLVVERLGWRNDDGLARMDPHRVHVLHVAHGDAVVAPVAHDLVLDLLPAAQALLDQYLAGAAGERALHRRIERLDGLHDPAALAAQRIAAAQHHGQADRRAPPRRPPAASCRPGYGRS